MCSSQEQAFNMVLSKNDLRKIDKKHKRAQHSVTEQTGIRCTSEPTSCLVVCNAGLSTGLQPDDLLAECTAHAPVDECIMLPDKSYCFLRLANAERAQSIFAAVHGRCTLGQHGSVLQLSFCESCPPAAVDGRFAGPLPTGLAVLDDFVDAGEEEQLLALFAGDHRPSEASLKHRSVQHFGYEFRYTTNDVDRQRPLLDRPIPEACAFLWARLHQRLATSDFRPDQLTVNVYEPGQGIPAHVDTHSPFADTICSLSLGDDVAMEFRRPDTGQQRSVWLARRSMLCMSGESRLAWSHAIVGRLFDCRPSADGPGPLSVRRRSGRRVSLTFRRLRDQPRCRCSWPALCDSAEPATQAEPMADAVEIERRNVHRVYDTIAGHFSETRHSPWPQVAQFVAGLGAGSVLVDVGCGNGKYLHNERVHRGAAGGVLLLGCDRSGGLLDVCRERSLNVWRCDCLHVPLRDGCADGCICIAVIHHLATEERRRQAIAEMVRVLRPGGQALVYVWAKNQAKDASKSTYLLQNRTGNTEAPPVGPKYVDGLPVHTNRTQFVAQDMLVPWKLKATATAGVEQASGEFLRFYHVFEEGELEALVDGVPGVRLVRSYYDQGNWCVVFERTQ